MRLTIAVIIACFLFSNSPLLAQDAQTEYHAQSHHVAALKTVPAPVKRLAKQIGPTRYYGEFQQDGKIFAVHFYDTSRVRADKSDNPYSAFSRDSKLDIFHRTDKSWRRLISYSLNRSTMKRTDKIKVDFQALWLNPDSKNVPVFYLQVMDNYGAPLVGNRTDIYGVLLEFPQTQHFIKFDCYLPYNPSTIYLSGVSFPDANGNVTLLFTESTPGGNDEFAYGWTGKDWKNVGHAKYEFGDDSSLHWNGTEFIK